MFFFSKFEPDQWTSNIYRYFILLLLLYILYLAIVGKKVHIFATTNNNYFNKSIITDMHYRITYITMYFQFADESKRAHKFICKNILSCINLKLAVRISKNHSVRTFITPQPIVRPNFRLIGLLEIKLPQKYFLPQTTDDRTDGRTDKRRVRSQ